MRIIKNRQIIDNPWRLESEPPLSTLSPEDQARPKLIAVSHWLEMRNTIRDAIRDDGQRRADVGVYLTPTDDVSAIAKDLDVIPVIALVFSSFTEGRGYSQSVELRQQYHYQGEIRAIGVAVDNLSLLERCGINAFQLDNDDDLERALSFFDDIETVYPYN